MTSLEDSHGQGWIDLGNDPDYDADLELARQLQEEEDRAARQFSRRPQGNFHCLLCYDDFDDPLEGVLLHCGHATCQDCFRHFAGIAITNTDILRCPSCNEPVTSSEIGFVCDEATTARYVHIETILIRRENGLFHCPTPDCPNSVVLEDRTQPLEFNCGVCNVSYCCRCASPWHGTQPTCLQREQERAAQQRPRPISISSSSSSGSGSGSNSTSASPNPSPRPSIDVVMTDNEDDANPADANSADFQFRKLVKKGIMRRCACGNYIEKNGGCNYVKCPACGTGFCWTCHQLLGAGKPNCKHTSGHGPNPYQFVWDKPMLKPKADVGHSDNIDDLTADGSQADLETRSRPSKCTIS